MTRSLITLTACLAYCFFRSVIHSSASVKQKHCSLMHSFLRSFTVCLVTTVTPRDVLRLSLHLLTKHLLDDNLCLSSQLTLTDLCSTVGHGGLLSQQVRFVTHLSKIKRVSAWICKQNSVHTSRNDDREVQRRNKKFLVRVVLDHNTARATSW